MSDYKVTHVVHEVELDLAEKLRITAIGAINESSSRSAEDAALVLKHRLADIDVDMSEDACLAAVERVRSGHGLTFDVDANGRHVAVTIA